MVQVMQRSAHAPKYFGANTCFAIRNNDYNAETLTLVAHIAWDQRAIFALKLRLVVDMEE